MYILLSMKNYLILFIFLTETYWGQMNTNKNSQEVCCKGRYPNLQLTIISPQELGIEYERLKKSGCVDCGHYGSDFQKVLEALGTRMTGATKEQLIKVMGKPDAAENDKLIYFWRGRHDYLFFVCLNGVVSKSGWYYALE
jgi:hypothetical protein